MGEDLHAVVVGHEEGDIPNLLEKDLRYLIFHIGMLSIYGWFWTPSGGWKREKFESVDAVATLQPASDVSIVDGREVTQWMKIERADKRGHTERYYPAEDQNEGADKSPIVLPRRWDHEHCCLCREHIDHDQFG